MREAGEDPSDTAALVRFDQKRKGKSLSNKDWQSETDPDSRIARMKDGTTHLAYKSEHTVDLDTGAMLGVKVYPADRGDPTAWKKLWKTLRTTLPDSMMTMRRNFCAW